MRNARIVIILSLFFILMAPSSNAQLCPGGGASFSSAVAFDPSWIYGCNTGTSCNGGVAFDNRAACQATTAMDACAPAPSCGSIPNNASNVWFTFYASAATATISCFQNTSLVIGVQAFKGGPACGSLTEIGCSRSGGPSSGVQLILTGLAPGTLYYFRVFGSAGPVSQRTGLYCFCGSTGLGNYLLLPTLISGFSAQATTNKIKLSWEAASANGGQYFEIEHSSDGNSFARLSNLPETAGSTVTAYQYTDALPLNGINYYRLKHLYPDGHYTYSNTISVKAFPSADFSILENPVRQTLQLAIKNPVSLIMTNISGQVLQVLNFAAGIQRIPAGELGNGIYFLQSTRGGKARKFCVWR